MGRAVAPATVDPFCGWWPIAHRILDRFGALASATDRARLLSSVLYKYNYAKTLGHPAFRPGAGEMLRSSQARRVHRDELRHARGRPARSPRSIATSRGSRG